jgi:hypothetical protein
VTASHDIAAAPAPGLGGRRVLASVLLMTALAVAHTWPLAAGLTRVSRMDNADAALNAWALAWVADHLLRDPARVFEGNIFHPEPHTVAFSEPLLVPGLLSAPVRAAGAGVVLTFNLSLLTGYVLSALAMQWLAWRWTGRFVASLVAGSLFAFNAFMLVRMGQLQAIHAYGLPVMVAGLDLVLRQPGWRGSAVLAAGVVLAAATSGYTTVFGLVALLLVLLVRPEAWRGQVGAVAVRGLVAAVAAGAVLAPVLWVYAEVRRSHGLVRDLDLVRALSANPAAFAATPGQFHYAAWAHTVYERWGPRESLFPGLVAVALALGYLASTRGWWRDGRVRALAAITVAGVVLAFGPQTPVYALVYQVVPFASSVRAAARFGSLALFGLAGLAAYAVAALEGRHRRAAALVALALVNLEAWRAPVPYVPVPPMSAVYAQLARLPAGVVVEMPFWQVQTDVPRNAPGVLMAAEHGMPLVNGYSGFVPASYRRHADALWFFPFRDSSFAMLRELDVRYVVVHLGDYGSDAARALAILATRPDFRLLADDATTRLYQVLRPGERR